MPDPIANLLPFSDLESAGRATLSYLHRLVGFRCWSIACREEDRWVVSQVEDHGFGLRKGAVFPWTDSFCSRMVAGLGPTMAPAVKQVPAYAQAPMRRQLSVESCISVPIVAADGSLFGTLCAMDPDEQPESIVAHLPLIGLLAQFLGTALAAGVETVQHLATTDEPQLLERERWRLAGILEGSNLGTWEWNVQTGEAVFNDRWAEIIGYTLDEISPVSIETWMKFAHPDDLEVSNDLLGKHFNGELDYYEFDSRMRHKNGSWVWVFDRGRVFSRTEDGNPLLMLGSHQDVTHRKRTELALRESEQRFEQLSKLDVLTGLQNRRGWQERIDAEEARAKRYEHPSCVIVVDLDGLKAVNDRGGHKAGDELIVRSARCIQSAVRDVDAVARLGGDEFAILGVECGEEGADALLERIEHALTVKGIQASWGMAMRHPDAGFEGAMAEADRHMYDMKAKRASNRSTRSP